MAVNGFDTVSYLEEARDRVTYAFTDKPIFDKYLQLLILGQVEIQEALKQVMQLRSIDTAEGEQLNVIGRIVGQPRELLEADFYQYFGFDGALSANPMGNLNDASVGGLFYSEGLPLSGNILLDDATYRKFIKAKIFKNTTNSSPEDFIASVNAILDTPISYITEGDAEVTVLFGRELTTFEKVLFAYINPSQGYPSMLIPKTVGVRVNYGEFDSENYFGFQGAPNASGFGSTGTTSAFGYGIGYGLSYGGATTEVISGGKFATLY